MDVCWVVLFKASIWLSVSKCGFEVSSPLMMWVFEVPPLVCRCLITCLGFEMSPPICGCWVVWLGFKVSPPIYGCWVVWLGFKVSHKYFLYYYPNWAPTNISYIEPTQISLISLPKLGHNIIPSLWKPISIYLMGKTQKSLTKFFTNPIATQHPITKACCYTALYYKAHYYTTPYYKARCYTTPYYETRCYTTPYYKARCYTTLFTKPVTTWHLITKSVTTRHSL